MITGIGIAKPKISPKFVPLTEDESDTTVDPETTVKPLLAELEAID